VKLATRKAHDFIGGVEIGTVFLRENKNGLEEKKKLTRDRKTGWGWGGGVGGLDSQQASCVIVGEKRGEQVEV